eukprot:c24131_g1_i1 orf=480-1106(+)
MSNNSSPQQPKLFVRNKHKKSQRSSGGQGQRSPPSTDSKLSSSAVSSTANEKVTSSRVASTSSSTPAGTVQQPIWHRYRTAITAFFAVNVAVFGYALFRSRSSPEVVEEQQPLEKETVQMEDEKKEIVTDGGNVVDEPMLHETSIMELAGTAVKVQPLVSDEHQQELFKWMLAELRKVKPANTSDRANIDKQKEVLKQFIKRKESFTS